MIAINDKITTFLFIFEFDFLTIINRTKESIKINLIIFYANVENI